jgi:hypothetical protein
MTADLWIPAVWTQFRAGNLTRAFRDVLLTLQTFDRNARIYPSHATLAARAACAVRTVQEALRQGRALGLVSWCSGASRRTSNRYALTLPKAAAQAGARLSRVAARIAGRTAAVARALVGRRRQEGEQKNNPGVAGQSWRNWPAPHVPLRTVAEQLEILARFRKEEGLRERKRAAATYVPT